jgi:hypothetical protein
MCQSWGWALIPAAKARATSCIIATVFCLLSPSTGAGISCLPGSIRVHGGHGRIPSPEAEVCARSAWSTTVNE